MKQMVIAVIVSLGLGMTACKKDVSNQTTGEVLNSGKWRVSYFWDKDHDETSDFAGYEFRFDNGTVTASNGSNTITGTYNDQGSDDSTPKFIINMNTGTGSFDELTDDWHVIEKSNTLIRLQEESGSGGIEYLNFSRI